MSKKPVTAREVLDWLATKPADEGYEYCDTGNCGFAQFLKETERAQCPSVSDKTWREKGSDTRFPMPEYVADSFNNLADTFGAAHTLLAQALAA